MKGGIALSGSRSSSQLQELEEVSDSLGQKEQFQPWHQVQVTSFQASRGGLTQAVLLFPEGNVDNEPPREKGASVPVSQEGENLEFLMGKEEHTRNTSLITRYRSLGLEISKVSF